MKQQLLPLHRFTKLSIKSGSLYSYYLCFLVFWILNVTKIFHIISKTWNFSAQSNNVEHNRTNTTIAALSAAADSSSDKPLSNQRTNLTPDHDGMQIEFRNIDSQPDYSIIPGHIAGDVEFGVLSNRDVSSSSSARTG